MQGTMSPKGAKGQNGTIGTKYYCSFCTSVLSYFTGFKTRIKDCFILLRGARRGESYHLIIPTHVFLASLGRGGIK